MSHVLMYFSLDYSKQVFSFSAEVHSISVKAVTLDICIIAQNYSIIFTNGWKPWLQANSFYYSNDATLNSTRVNSHLGKQSM